MATEFFKIFSTFPHFFNGIWESKTRCFGCTNNEGEKITIFQMAYPQITPPNSIILCKKCLQDALELIKEEK